MVRYNPARDHIGRAITTIEGCALNRLTLRLQCGCGHVALLDGVAVWALAERRRWPGDLRKLAAHFYCGQCFARKKRRVRLRTIQLTNETPVGKQPPYPDERTWKRLIARYKS